MSFSHFMISCSVTQSFQAKPMSVCLFVHLISFMLLICLNNEYTLAAVGNNKPSLLLGSYWW